MLSYIKRAFAGLALLGLFFPLTASATYIVPQGGTGIISATAHGVLIGNGSGAFNVTSPGTAGQVLTSNGSGADPTFQASSGGGGSGFSTTSTNYWFTTKTTDNLTEGSTNLYFTNARAQNAISLTTTGSSGAATYSGGVLNIPQYTGGGGGTGVFPFSVDSLSGNLVYSTSTPTLFFKAGVFASSTGNGAFSGYSPNGGSVFIANFNTTGSNKSALLINDLGTSIFRILDSSGTNAIIQTLSSSVGLVLNTSNGTASAGLKISGVNSDVTVQVGSLFTAVSGLLSNASSTIGDSTQAGGLSISGGATTTGFLTVQSLLSSTIPNASTTAISASSAVITPRITSPSGGGGLVFKSDGLFTFDDTNGQYFFTPTAGSLPMAVLDFSAVTTANKMYSFPNSAGTVCLAGVNCVGGRADFDFATFFSTSSAATTTSIHTVGIFTSSSTAAASQFPYASTTQITATNASTTGLTVSGVVSALHLASATGIVSAYGGASACSANNFVTTISAVGGTSCGTASISGVNLGSNLNAHTHDTSLTGTSYNGSAAVSDWGLALGHSNIWTVLQSFLGNASSSQMSVFGKFYAGGTGTTTINSSGDLFVAGSTTLQNVTAVNATSSGIGILNSKGCNTTSALTTDGNGTIVCGAITGGGGASFAYPFTNNATTSILTFSNGHISNGTSTFNGQVQITPNANGIEPLYIGTSTTGCPIYGCIQGDIVDAEMNINNITGVNVVNDNRGTCAGSGFWADGDIPVVSNNYAFFGYLNTGWTGSGCAVGNGLERQYSTLEENRTGDWNIELSSTTRTNFSIYGNGGLLLQRLQNDTGNFGLGGTTTPGSTLSVQGNQFIAGNITSTSTTASRFPYASSTGITVSGVAQFGATGASDQILIGGGSIQDANISGGISIQNVGAINGVNASGGGTTATANTRSGITSAGNAWGFSTRDGSGGTNTFRLVVNNGYINSNGDSSGVGIGTSTPWWPLQITNTQSNFVPQLTLSDNTATDNHWSFWNKAGSLFLSTSSPSTVPAVGAAGTSTATALMIDKNAVTYLQGLTLPNIPTCNTTNALTTTNGLVSCGAITGGAGGSGAQSSSTVQFVIYPVDQSSNPSQYFMYNATSTAVTQSANFQTLLKNAVSSIGGGGSYSGTAQGNGPGGAIFIKAGTYYTNATTTCNGNEVFSTNNSPRCEIFGAGQEATKIVVVGGADAFNFDHGAIPSVHDLSIYTTGYEKAIVATSSNPNIRSIWQFDFHNLNIESTTTFATTTAFYLGNVLRGQIYNIETYGQNNTFWFYAEGNFNVGGVTLTRSFMDFSSAATSTAFKFTQNSTGFVNEVEGYYNEAIGRTSGATYIDSTGLSFSHFNDSSAEQMDVLVDAKSGTVSNQFDFAYSINRNGGANLRGCRFWSGSYDNQCSFQNGNNDASTAIIDDMNLNTDFPNRIAGTINQTGGTGSASSSANSNYQIINFHGTGTFDANFKPDSDWTGYQIWSKVVAKSYKSFLSGANAAAGLFVDINTSIATNVGVFIQDNTNFAHAGDMLRIVLKNSSDSANGVDIQNLGTGASINATSSRGTDFIVQGGKSGFGTSTPFGFFSVNPNNIGSAPLFVIGSSSVTNFMVKSANVAALMVGTTTVPASPTNIAGFFVNSPAGTGAFASTTVIVSDPSTTTSRGQIQMNNSAGSPVCIDVRGTALTVTSGVCP